MIRVAAVGDIHLGEDMRGHLRPALEKVGEHADILLLAGDLTRHGTVVEAAVVADEFADLPVPVVAVLGNHDHHDDKPLEVTKTLAGQGHPRAGGHDVHPSGERLLDRHRGREGVRRRVRRQVRQRVRRARDEGVHPAHLRDRGRTCEGALSELDTDIKVALTHYAPVPDTLRGEPPEIYPFLGSYLLGEAIDATGTDLAVHGHAHFGTEQGMTPGGVRVRNVAQPIIRSAYTVYVLEGTSS